MRALAICLVISLALTGCTSPLGAQRGDEPAWVSERAWFLHSTMTLASAAEAESHAVATKPFFQAWAAGDDYPTWLLDPWGRDVVVTNASVTLFVRATGPVVESYRFPDIMVYLGSGDAWMGYGERRDLSTFSPGAPVELRFDIALPEGGLWLAPDVPMGVKVVPVMLQQEQANLEILVGGREASRVDARVEPIEVARVRETSGAVDGELLGTAYAGAAAPASTTEATPIALPSGASYLVAWMNTTASDGVPDLDISFRGPDGEEIASAGTPRPREEIRVAGANLRAPGAHALVVSTAGAPRAAYSLEWRVGLS